MQNIQTEYLEVLLPGFTTLPQAIKNTFQKLPVWDELVCQIGTIEEESKETLLWLFTNINSTEVKRRLDNLKPHYEEAFQPMLKAIQLERYPFLTFLQQNHIDLENSTPQQIAEHINRLKTDYFRYRFASIPFLGPNEECLNFWNDHFEIPPENINSIEALHQWITNLEVSILEDWIFTKINAAIGNLLPNSHELFYKIKTLSQNISKKPQQEEILKPLVEFIQNHLSHGALECKAPELEQAQTTLSQMFNDILGALSKNLPHEVAEIADVHAIIQASGFSTQNEYSHLAILDFVNYIKYTEEIKNLKTISSAFIRPLLPLYWELLYVSKQPKNIFNIIRLIMPLVLLTAYLIAIETLFNTVPALIALLSILHAPEVAMILTMAISIYVGLVLMSYAYEHLKIAYHYLSNIYYGGQYETPVYQVNSRMEAIFGSVLAQDIRTFYIENMQKLDADIQRLEHEEKNNGLDQRQLEMLQNSQNTRKKMELEWMGIHHLQKLATNTAKAHVKARLQEKIKDKYENFKTMKTSDLNKLSDTIHVNLMATNGSNSLFQPQCLGIKREIESLVAKRNQIV